MIRTLVDAVLRRRKKARIVAGSERRQSGRATVPTQGFDEPVEDDSGLLVRSVNKSTRVNGIVDQDLSVVDASTKNDNQISYRQAEIGTPFTPPE